MAQIHTDIFFILIVMGHCVWPYVVLLILKKNYNQIYNRPGCSADWQAQVLRSFQKNFLILAKRDA